MMRPIKLKILDKRLGDALHCQVNLRPAVATKAAKDVTGKTFAVNPYQHRFSGGYVAHYQRQVFIGINIALIGSGGKLSVFGW